MPTSCQTRAEQLAHRWWVKRHPFHETRQAFNALVRMLTTYAHETAQAQREADTKIVEEWAGASGNHAILKARAVVADAIRAAPLVTIEEEKG